MDEFPHNPPAQFIEFLRHHTQAQHICLVSCLTGQGLPSFINTLQNMVQQFFENSSIGGPMITRARHRENLQMCNQAIKQCLARIEEVELAAESLRLAINSIGRITGKVDVEQILGVIFNDFCIGK